MATSYHLKRGNKINGPFSIEELRKLSKSQKLKPEDRLAQSPEGPWQRLTTVLTEFGDGQAHPSSGPSQDGAAVDQVRAKTAKTPPTRKGVQRNQREDDDFLSALSSAVSQTAKLATIEVESPETEQELPKSKKRSRKNETFNPLGLLVSIYEDNQPFSQVAMFIMIFCVCTAGAVAVMKQMAAPVRGTRIQKEFMGKTLGKWLELEAEGKARQSEVLWRDNRWTPLDSVIGLDYAALPEVFNALTNPATKSLALTILQKVPTPGESPSFEDLEKGLRHSDPLVSEWAARMARAYKGEREGGSRVSEVIALLETIASSGNREAATASLESLTVLKGPAP